MLFLGVFFMFFFENNQLLKSVKLNLFEYVCFFSISVIKTVCNGHYASSNYVACHFIYISLIGSVQHSRFTGDIFICGCNFCCSVQIQIICLWEIMLIVDIIQLKQ